jgi:hypothetical protein
MHRITQPAFVMTMAIFLIVTTSLGQEEGYTPPPTPKEATAEAMLADVLLLRPFGLAATILGTAVFIVALPFTLPTRSVDEAAQKLIVDPGKFTFARPLGQEPREPTLTTPDYSKSGMSY